MSTEEDTEQRVSLKEAGAKLRQCIKKEKDRITPRVFVGVREDGFEYIDEEYFRNRLDSGDLCDSWNTEYVTHTIIPDWGILYVIKVFGTFDDMPYSLCGEGGAEWKRNRKTQKLLSRANTFKAAAADAFKKGVNKKFRVGDDVYLKNKESILNEITKLADNSVFTSEEKSDTINAAMKTHELDTLLNFLTRVKEVIKSREKEREEDGYSE